MPEAHHLMFTGPNTHPPESLAEVKTGPAVLEEQLPGSSYTEQTVLIKLEPKAEEFLTESQAGTDNGMAATDQSQLWMEKSGEDTKHNVCVLIPDVRYPLSPAAEAPNEQHGYTSAIKDMPFLDQKDSKEAMIGDQYSTMGIHSTSSDMTLVPELQPIIQEVPVSDYAALSDGTHEGGVFEFNLTASGDHQDSCGQDPPSQNCFICSSCGQSFDTFNLFQCHECKNITELPFTCEICGKSFNQMSVLKLHLKLHV